MHLRVVYNTVIKYLRKVGTGDVVFGVCLLKQTCSQLIDKLPSLIG